MFVLSALTLRYAALNAVVPDLDDIGIPRYQEREIIPNVVGISRFEASKTFSSQSHSPSSATLSGWRDGQLGLAQK